MKDWFTKNMGDALLATGSLRHLEEAFLSSYETAGKPDDMAAFIRHESEGRLHYEVIIYLSPNSSAVARTVGADPCERPSPGDLGLFAGSKDSWLTLFPGHDRK